MNKKLEYCVGVIVPVGLIVAVLFGIMFVLNQLNPYYNQEYCLFFGENSTKECTVFTDSGYCREWVYYGVANNKAVGCWDIRVLKGKVVPRQIITNLSREEYYARMGTMS